MNQFQCLVVKTIFFTGLLLSSPAKASDEEHEDRGCLAPVVDEKMVKELGQIFYNIQQQEFLEGDHVLIPNTCKKDPKNWAIRDVDVEQLLRKWAEEYQCCCYNYPNNCLQRIRDCDCGKSYARSARACDTTHCITCAVGLYFGGRALCCHLPEWGRYVAIATLIEPIFYGAMRCACFLRGDRVKHTIKGKLLHDSDIAEKILAHARSLVKE